MADSPCWVPVFPDGTQAVVWPDASTPHWPSEERARERIGEINPSTPVVARRLDHPCVIVVCVGCSETFDGSSTIHFDDLEEVRIAFDECSEWNRWTILPDGGYLCDLCHAHRSRRESDHLESLARRIEAAVRRFRPARVAAEPSPVEPEPTPAPEPVEVRHVTQPELPATKFKDTADEDLAPEDAVVGRLAVLVAQGLSPWQAACELFIPTGERTGS